MYHSATNNRGRTLKSLSEEYGIHHTTISLWVRKYRDEAAADAEKAKIFATLEENRRLHKKLAELEKENDFLKKSRGVLCEGKQVSSYHFIDKYSKRFGVAWILKSLNISPTAYYNYRKHRKSAKQTRKAFVLKTIKTIYHESGGKPGYRMMQKLLAKKRNYS